MGALKLSLRKMHVSDVVLNVPDRGGRVVAQLAFRVPDLKVDAFDVVLKILLKAE